MEDAAEEPGISVPGALRTFLGYEQRNLWRAERFRASTDDGLDPKYLPENGLTFRLPCFSVRRRYLYVCGARGESLAALGMFVGEDPDGYVLFAIHPAELEYQAQFLADVRAVDARAEGVRLWATPTSSTRTLLVWPDVGPKEAFFAKLSLHSRTLGDRRIGRRDVATSVGLSQFVYSLKSCLPDGIRCLPERLGVVSRVTPGGGMLVRTIPEEVKGGNVILAPLFALIGESAGHPPLLLRLMEAAGAAAREVLEEVLLAKFAKTWVELVFEHGLILEAHGQDLLLALSPDLVPLNALYYRDFEGLAVDWALRRAKGLPIPESPPDAFAWFSTYETWGYPLYQLVSVKLMTSLSHFLDLTLSDLESALQSWQAEGVVGGKGVQRGELTSLFSWHLREVIREKFGAREHQNYDVHRHVARFTKFLMQVRREIMHGTACDTRLERRFGDSARER